MKTIAARGELRDTVGAWRKTGQRIAFVPTMGNLHAGHGDLVTRARKLADRVIVSIFVNPMQFGPNEDFAQYPRTPGEDAELLTSLSADALFIPDAADIYPEGFEHSTFIDVPGLTDILCGAFRPGHFRGVATVVAKLFNLVAPDVAVFGEKDFQQLMVIRRMVVDLCMPIEIIGAPTVRETDGLAKSSRNRYLSAQDRAAAPAIFKALTATIDRLKAGDRNFGAMERIGAESLATAGFKLDYFAVRDAANLQAPTQETREFVVLTAARIGKARLIDNMRVAV